MAARRSVKRPVRDPAKKALERLRKERLEPWEKVVLLNQCVVSGMRADALGKELGYSTSHIRNLIRLRALSPADFQAFRDEGHGAKITTYLPKARVA